MNEVLAKLDQVKLRKSAIVHDSSAPVLDNVMEKEQEIKDYHNRVLDLNMEAWVDLLGETTFATRFVPITADDAKLFMDAYELVQSKVALPGAMEDRLSQIEIELQKVIDEVRGADDCVFVKTSCRSAKDTSVFDTRFSELYHECLQRNKVVDENAAIIALLDAAIEVLKVRSAKDVIQTFIRSERVYSDFSIALKVPERFSEHFAIRKWVTIDPSMEFRGFYANGQLNALSQYNHLAYFPEVFRRKNELSAQLQTFFVEHVESRLRNTFKQYIVDFAVVADKIYVIELNPFLQTTDGALFSWQKEQKLLEHGPFEFRVLAAPVLGAKSLLARDWRDMFEKETKKLQLQKLTS